MRTRILLGIVVALMSTSTLAALHGRRPATPGGVDYRAYYDDVLEITWVANADLAQSNSFGVAGIFPNGTMTWDTAQLWIAGMNTANYLGVNDWRLPFMVDTGTPGCNLGTSGTDCGYNVQTKSGAIVYSEIAHLFYVTLGNIGAVDAGGSPTGCIPGGCLSNRGPFSNMHDDILYWFETVYAPDTTQAWNFGFGYGYQNRELKTHVNNAWAVRDGDIGLVPADADGDGFADFMDNCMLTPNSNQCDTDVDGFGNRCDGDLNNNGATNAQDYAMFRVRMGTTTSPSGPWDVADLNCNGVVNAQDYGIFRTLLGKQPGPSGFDGSAPTVTISAPPAEGSTTTSTSANVTITSSEPATICWTLDDAVSSVCSAGGATNFAASMSDLLTGHHQLTATASDYAGNVGSSVRNWNIAP